MGIKRLFLHLLEKTEDCVSVRAKGTHSGQALLEEFGKWIKNGTSANLAERNEFYQAIYQQVYQVRSISL